VVHSVSNSGGSKGQNFCYNEQNQLVWAGNSGSQPGAGNGTCGSGTLSNSLNGAGYGSSFVSTHLGQLWQGPLNGTGTPQQYLYCDSSHPHRLTGVFQANSTCSNKQGQGYASTYDAFGKVSSRSYNTTTATLSYDGLDQLVSWDAGSSSQEQYIYDAAGQRVLRRSTVAGSTTLTVYAFGLEEHRYSGTGVNQGNTYYYRLGGRLVGESTGSSTNMLLTDALGSVITTISATAGNASVQGNQAYGPPYGNSRYQAGTMGTAKGFTGQYQDATGLDYYNARYYDPVVGRFLSADTVQGNSGGLDPYAYVQDNPETNTDPTGQAVVHPPESCHQGSSSNSCDPQQALKDLEAYMYRYATSSALGPDGLPILLYWFLSDRPAWALAESYAEYYLHSTTLYLAGLEAYDLLRNTNINWNASLQLKDLYIHLNSLALTYATAAMGDPGFRSMRDIEEVALLAAEKSALAMEGEDQVNIDSNGTITPCSFTSATEVATDHGKQTIGTLRIGERVLAYNPKTGKMEYEPILHVWLHPDNDLVDLTMTTTTKGQHGKPATKTSEVIHTNQKHPFFTIERGFLPVGRIKIGMHVLRADGRIGVITGWKVVLGTSLMYNLEVAQDHTFTVGVGQWVVHNCGPDFDAAANEIKNNYDFSSLIDNAGGTQNWTFEGIDGNDSITNKDLLDAGYTERYYFRFKTPYGDVKVSADYDPKTGQWNGGELEGGVGQGFHLSSDQYNQFWQDFWLNNP
jgi:RHS repeat-associated protein